MNKKTKKGFTITELVIVIAVIAILAAVLIPTFSNVIKNANESVALQEARSEWDNFAPEIATESEKGDYLIVYKKDKTQVYFLVVDGQFNANSVTVTENPEGTFTYEGALADYKTATAPTGYTVMNAAHIKLYKLEKK